MEIPKKITLIDGYVDEPSCLGVPPYISPYIRYTYGALLLGGLKEEQIEYVTIDNIRANQTLREQILSRQGLVIIIAGTTVPGRYLGGKPISLKEIKNIAQNTKSKVWVGGPITLCAFDIPYVDRYLDEIGAIKLFELLNNNSSYMTVSKGLGAQSEQNELSSLIDRFAIEGSKIVTSHPHYPHVICELETYRGCLRDQNCSFCSESLKQVLYTREPERIADEVEALNKQGVEHFRLGSQTDLFMYGAIHMGGGLVPNPDQIYRLYAMIRAKAPNLKVLHMDNVSPTTIANFPKEARDIMRTIVKHNTPGDTAAFGLESCDPKVLEENWIGTNPAETLKAIELMNEIGGQREKGIPKLLPGVNLLYGLKGECPETYGLNFQFLKRVLDQGLLLRRINLRQVREIAGYRGQKVKYKFFTDHKEKVNREINKPMLEKVFPKGTILKNVITEKQEGQITYGRQLGTYPILVGLPGEHVLNTFVNARIIDHGYRSITGLIYPFNINKAQPAELSALPGVGKKRASTLFINKPIKDIDQLKEILGNSVNIDEIIRYIDDFS